MNCSGELCSGEEDTIRKSKELTVIMTQGYGRVVGGTDSVRKRFGRLRHDDAVGRFTGRTWVCYAKEWAALMSGKTESLHR